MMPGPNARVVGQVLHRDRVSIVKAQVDDTLLHQAATAGDVALVRYLLDRGAEVDATAELDRTTALHAAVAAGQTEVAQLLIARGADIDARAVGSHRPLHKAAAGGHADLVALLLDRGADIHAVSSGGTALHLAAREGHHAVVTLLLHRGAEVDARSGEYSGTPLMMAARNGHGSAVTVLLQNGADLDASDRNRMTALSYASSAGHAEVVALLRRHGTAAEQARLQSSGPARLTRF